MACTCADMCPGCETCACMFVHGDGGDCQFICTNCPGTPPEGTTVLPPGTFPGIALDHLVDFDMRNASLGEAAELLARRAYAEIFVPVNRIDERRDMRLESVPLDTVVRELGLMAVEPAS